MSRLADHMLMLRTAGRKALVPFLTAGYPDMQGFLTLLKACSDSGADVIEIGLPFSDPVADGPAIQLSSSTALAGGFRLEELFSALQGLAPLLPQPLVAMTYVNPVLSYGVPRFARDAAEAGFDGVILPDLPLGEQAEIGAALANSGLDLIRLVAPTTDAARIERIAKQATGFIYLVSIAGVTGERRELPEQLGTLAKRVKDVTSLPVLIGFGIGTPEQAATAAVHGDGVIVGSALMRLIAESPSLSAAELAVSQLLRYMRKALDAATNGAEA